MTRRTRRRSGLTLLTLLAVQSFAAPLGACAQEHQQHDDAAHEMATVDHADATSEAQQGQTEASHHAPDSAPVDCLALAACGAPAIGTSIATAQVVFADQGTRTLRSAPVEPAAIVLGLTTPPPKI